MNPRLRKGVLAVHITFSVGWIGAVIVYLALGVSATTSPSTQRVRAAWTAMELTGWYVIVPIAVASLLTGLFVALSSRWGLFRHYWVLLSFVLTLFSTVILVLHMPTVSAAADVARQSEGAALRQLGGDLAHPGFGLTILLAVQLMNIYKPRGLTPYGWRQQEAGRISTVT